MRALVTVALVFVVGCKKPVEALPTEAEVHERLDRCAYTAGALPRDTVAFAGGKIGAQLPIDHFVLVMQENRSFDHYFSQLSHGGVRVAPPGAVNPDSAGNPVARYHETQYCIADVNHGWNGSHTQFADGGMSGFVVSNDPNGARALGYFDETDIPFYYGLARTFALSDAHFSSVMGPTQPNRQFYWAGTSFGAISNGLAPLEVHGKPVQTLFSRLDDAKVPWLSYGSGVPSPAIFVGLLQTNLENFKAMESFFADAEAGTLPPVSVVEASFTGGVEGDQDDEHPSANMQYGQLFTSRVVNAVMHSPQWPHTALIFLYDEHGGFYDSVPPPKACEPDDLYPDGGQRFDHLGFRTPLIVVSPYAKRGFVSHTPIDHTSVTRLVETRFGLPALTARDANAWPLFDLFDWEHPDTSVPQLPEAVIDPMHDTDCKAAFP